MLTKKLELVFPLCVAIVLILRTVIITIEPALKPAWGDEYFTYYQVDHSSYKDLWISLNTHVNAAPPQYFIFAWVITKMFSCSILTLRLISTLSCSAAFFVTWITLRKNISYFSSSLGVCIIFLGSDLFLRYSAEARFYGPYLFGVSLIFYSFDSLCKSKYINFLQLLINIFSQAFAISTCYIAGLFSFGMLIAVLAWDKRVGMWRPKIYISYLIGWIPLLFCMDSIQNSGSNITGWIPIPDRYYLFHPFNPEINLSNLYYVIFFFSILGLIMSIQKKDIIPSSPLLSKLGSEHLFYAAVTFLAVPYIMLIISWLGKPMMIDRYYLPSLLGMVILLGISVDKIFPAITYKSFKVSICNYTVKFILISLLILNPLILALHFKRNQSIQKEDSIFQEKASLVVADNWPTYLPLCFHNPSALNLFMVTEHDTVESVTMKKFNEKIRLISLDNLVCDNKIILVEDLAYDQFSWLKSVLEKKGFHSIKNDFQKNNNNILWTLYAK